MNVVSREPAVHVAGLRKAFGSKLVLEGIDLERDRDFGRDVEL